MATASAMTAAAASDYDAILHEAEHLHQLGVGLITVIPVELPAAEYPSRKDRAKPAFTGKNPSQWTVQGEPLLLSHGKVPTFEETIEAVEIARDLGKSIGLAIVPADSLVVIDFDLKDYGGDPDALNTDVLRLLEEHPELGQTRVETTPGGGVHVYVRVADRMASWSYGSGSRRCRFTTTDGGPHRGEVLSGTRISVTAPTRNGRGPYEVINQDHAYDVVEVPDLAAIGVFPVVGTAPSSDTGAIQTELPRPPVQQQQGLTIPRLEDLLRRNAQEALRGGRPYGQDRSSNLTGFLNELYSWGNFLAAAGLPADGSPGQLIAAAVAALGIEDKAERVAGTITPSTCTFRDPEKALARYQRHAGQRHSGVAAAADFPDLVEPQGASCPPAGEGPLRHPIPLTEAQSFELLRGRAAQILTEHPRKVEQELAMRMAATDLGLPALGQQQIRTLLWEARNGDAGPVQPLTPDQPLSLAPTPWLLEGVVMAGALNLIVALPKIGKTALMLGFLAAWLHGQQDFLGCGLPATPCPPILIVGTDQPENDWGRMLKQFGLLDHLNRLPPRIVGLFTAGRPLHLDAEGIDRIASYAEQHPGLLVLVDSLHACISPLGLKEESAEVAEPVRDLMSSLEAHGATVLMIHHANKARTNDGAVAASRGSTALPAVASQTISLTRLQPGSGGHQSSKERRLVLKTEGRGGMPQGLLIERTDDQGWICHGDADAALEVQAREQARERLTDRQQGVLRVLCERAKAGETTTPADVVRELGHPRNRALETLEALVQKRLALKTPGQPTPDGGRPPATYSPVPDACAEP